MATQDNINWFEILFIQGLHGCNQSEIIQNSIIADPDGFCQRKMKKLLRVGLTRQFIDAGLYFN